MAISQEPSSPRQALLCVKNPDDLFLDIFFLVERTLAPWLACYHVITVQVWSSDLPLSYFSSFPF